MVSTRRGAIVVLDECVAFDEVDFLGKIKEQYDIITIVRIGKDYLFGCKLRKGMKDTEVRGVLVSVAENRNILMILVTRDRGFKSSARYHRSHSSYLIVLILQECSEIIKRFCRDMKFSEANIEVLKQIIVEALKYVLSKLVTSSGPS